MPAFDASAFDPDIANRDLLITAIFEVCGEDYQVMARILRRLEARFPAVAWRSRAATLAQTWQPFIDSGLSINWFTAEVARLADSG